MPISSLHALYRHFSPPTILEINTYTWHRSYSLITHIHTIFHITHWHWHSPSWHMYIHLIACMLGSHTFTHKPFHGPLFDEFVTSHSCFQEDRSRSQKDGIWAREKNFRADLLKSCWWNKYNYWENIMNIWWWRCGLLRTNSTETYDRNCHHRSQ